MGSMGLFGVLGDLPCNHRRQPPPRLRTIAEMFVEALLEIGRAPIFQRHTFEVVRSPAPNGGWIPNEHVVCS